MLPFDAAADVEPARPWTELIEQSRRRGTTLRRRRKVAQAAVPFVAIAAVVSGFVLPRAFDHHGPTSHVDTTNDPQPRRPTPLPDPRVGTGSGTGTGASTGTGAGSATGSGAGSIGVPTGASVGSLPAGGGPSGDTHGGRIAFVSNRDGHDHIYVMNADGTDEQQVTSGSSWDFEPALSRDGTRIAFTRDSQDPGSGASGRLAPRLYVVALTDPTLAAVPVPLPATDDLAAETAAWSPDGTELAYKLTPPVNGNPRRSEIWVSKPDGSDGRAISPSNASAHTPSWSPDGTRIAFRRVGTGTKGTGGQTDQLIGIFVADAKDGADLTQLTTTDDLQPVWSPDGTRMVFTSFRDGRSDVYVMNADGSGQIRLTDASAYDQAPNWSPDGSTIMFDRDPDSRDPTACTTLPDSPLWSSGAQACGAQPADAGPAPSALWTIAADGSGLRQFTNDPWSDFAASWIEP